ncbi:helix-turn-helix domain-containing protein [Clostridium felsineum]|uniref:helix-turn-helix domain-containing protein n=1 Tax=Clostridium felsineum TaxID=36839 RepID=UPI00214DDA30|nr:helix-turn-helix transcriptional regulator [Clostridium felsineum]MCR3761733.1 helix-turn-helix domain-containing protein [Clostridium felsineum]
MSTYEILPAGVKLKNLREKYALLQEDLSGKEITRNLISQIEHGKARLTRHAAEVMLKNLKDICHKRNITVDEDIDYLLEDEETQANKVLDNYIKELKDLLIYKDCIFKTKLDEIEEFLVDWDIKDKKIIIFELAGDHYSNINDLQTSLIYYEKAKALININTFDDNFVSILRKLSMVYYYMGRYEDNIRNSTFALNHFKNMNEEYYCIFIYNSALCYIKLKEYTKAIKSLNKIEGIIKNINITKYYQVLEQEVVCYGELQQYQKSLEINEYIANNIDKKKYQEYLISLINLTNNYINTKNDKKLKETLNKIYETTDKLNQDSNFLPEIYSELGEIHNKLYNIKKSEEFYLKALNYAKKLNRNSITKEILSKLFDIYTDSKDKENISKMKDEFFVICGKEGKITTNLERKLIEFYLEVEDIQALKELYKFNKRLS